MQAIRGREGKWRLTPTFGTTVSVVIRATEDFHTDGRLWLSVFYPRSDID